MSFILRGKVPSQFFTITFNFCNLPNVGVNIADIMRDPYIMASEPVPNPPSSFKLDCSTETPLNDVKLHRKPKQISKIFFIIRLFSALDSNDKLLNLKIALHEGRGYWQLPLKTNKRLLAAT